MNRRQRRKLDRENKISFTIVKDPKPEDTILYVGEKNAEVVKNVIRAIKANVWVMK